MIKAILFDFNGVFVEPIENEILATGCQKLGTGEWIAKTNYYSNLWSFQQGFMSPFEFWSRVFAGISSQEYLRIVEARYEQRLARDDKVFAIRDDAAKKCKVFVLSNTNFLQGKSYRKQGLYKGFDGLFLSHEVNSMKPFPSFFKKFSEATSLKPSECLLIDDSSRNCLAAALLGYKTIVFKDARQLDFELKKLGLL
ncbi:MAG: HAD-IA family hydrolase [archaeon]|nr:HAD-IA family hydrolase [archaeon]